MASKRKSAQGKAAAASGSRQRRSDEEKIRIVRQVMASGNQSAEIKKLGIYPNQFYDWKKRFVSQLGGAAGGRGGRRGRGVGGGTAADEAKAFIQNKSALLDRLRRQREELDQLIDQLEG